MAKRIQSLDSVYVRLKSARRSRLNMGVVGM